MFIHTFYFKWQPGVTEAQRSAAVAAIRALQGQIPGLLSTYVGTNTSPRSNGYDLGGVMHFTDQDAFSAYNVHPIHRQLVGWLMPLLKAIEVDFDPNL